MAYRYASRIDSHWPGRKLLERKPTTGRLYSVNENSEVYGRPFKLCGYIYSQNSRAVEPMELRGLLVRIRNIGYWNLRPNSLKIAIVSRLLVPE